VGFVADPEGAVEREYGEGGDACEDGVPIEDAGGGVDLKIGPQGEEEFLVGIEGDAADDIAESSAEEDS
jgi:hypothetical protein